MHDIKIFIGGDSWGYGELPNLEHLGLSQYLTELGYTVINSSKIGSSNQDSIGLLLENLKLHFKPNDIVLWIQSDPVRNLSAVSPNPLLHDAVKQAGGLINLMNNLLVSDYNQLQSIGRRFNTQIYLIGGLTSIRNDLVIDRPRLVNLVPSWVELLVGHLPKYADIDWAEFRLWTGNWTVDDLNLHGYNDNKFAGQVIEELYQIDTNRRVFKEPIFHPDGIHPNREGHRVLFNYLKDKLKL